MNHRLRRVFRGIVSAAATILFVSVSVPTALGAPSAAPDTTWMVNGKVYAMALSADRSTLFIGGKFTRLLPPPGGTSDVVAAHNLAAVDAATGVPVPSWSVSVTGDTSFVRALAVQDGVLYVGGRFTAVNGHPRHNVASVDLSTRAVGAFAPHVGAQPKNAVYSLVASSDRLYVGGAFGRVDGLSRAKLAAFELPSGSLSSAWKPRVKSGAVRDLEFDASGTSVFAAGAFDSVAQSGQTIRRESLARFDAATGRLRAWSVPNGVIGAPQTGWDITVTASTIYGGFGRGPNFAAAFALDQGDTGTLRWRANYVGNVQTVLLSADGSRLFIGGHMGLGRLQQTVCGSIPLRGLLSLNPTDGARFCDWVPQLAPYGHNYNGPWTMLQRDQKLWVGGGWTTIDGVKHRNIARFGL